MSARLVLFVGLSVVVAPAPANDETTAYYVRANGRDEAVLWKASSSGKISPVNPAFAIWSVDGYFNDIPAVSPDNRMLAFAWYGDLWVRDLASLEEWRITKSARPDDGEYARVGVEVRGWSPGSDRLLYEIVRPDRFPRDSCGMEERPAPIVRAAPYGLYLYELRSHTSRAVTLPGEFAAWIAGDEIAVSAGPRPFVASYLRTKLGATDTAPKPFLPDRRCGQFQTHPEGSRLLALCDWDDKSQLVELDLLDGHVMSTMAEGTFAEHQWPRFSPSGRRIAWIRQSRFRGAQPIGALIVDSNTTFACPGAGSVIGYRWIDDDTVFCDCADDFYVVEVPTGAVKGKVRAYTLDRAGRNFERARR